MAAHAALYLRSSKDRSDVSIDAQRHELQKLAQSLSVPIIAEFSDVVMSGQDADRPGFVAMKAALQDRARGWDTLLAMDTARIARDSFEQAWIHRECARQGIRIHYALLPQTGSAADVILLNTMRGVDHWHSLVSKEKGLAGMRENVRKGFRAGGRAPVGYRLEHIPTGAVRDGLPVMKSRLVVNESAAPAIAAFLRDRARGLGRTEAAAAAGLRLPYTTLSSVEWNALTYAGHTVWNVHNEKVDRGYRTGAKRRPRGEWEIRYDTHAALIDTQDAETILTRLEGNYTARRAPKKDSLLGGLLVTPQGTAWHGYVEDQNYYRSGKGKRIQMRQVDELVVSTVISQLRSRGLVADLARYAQSQKLDAGKSKRAAELRTRLDAIEGRIARVASLVPQMEHPRAFLEQIDELEKERGKLEQERMAAERAAKEAASAASVTEDQVARLLERAAADMHTLERYDLKRLISSVTEKITLDPKTMAMQIHYRVTAGGRASGDKDGSPWGRHEYPAILRAIRKLKVA